MTNSHDPTPTIATGAAATTVPPARRRSAGHIVAIVLGCLGLLPALGVLGGGVAIAVAQGVATDDDGYFSVSPDRIRSDGVAVTSDETWFADDDAAPWVLGWLDLDVRLRVDGAEGTDDVFVGVARSADVDAYLGETRHSVVDEFDNDRPIYREVSGAATVGSPVEQDFWAASASGDGEQEVEWEARSGRWTIVVMNADGTSDVAADVEVGARSGAVTPIMVTLLIAGGLGTLVSIGLIVFGVRGGKQRGTGADSTTRPPFTGTLPPPTPGTAAAEVGSAEEDRSPTPIG